MTDRSAPIAEVYVDSFCFALGDVSRTVEEAVASGATFSGAAELRAAGFARHHVCADATTAYDLALRAVEPLHLSDIDAIVYTTCLPGSASIDDLDAYRRTGDVKHLMRYPASRLQSDLGLDRAIVVGLNQQACTGLLGALRLARSLLLSEPGFTRVLCVTADRFPAGARYEQAYNLVSDGAAGCLVSRAPGRFRLLTTHQITNGAMVEASDDEVVGSYFSYTARLVQETLNRCGWSALDVDWVVPQNTDPKAWQILVRLLGLDRARVHQATLPRVAHVISGDNILNLADLMASSECAAGDRLLLVMAGYGMNWQATAMQARS